MVPKALEKKPLGDNIVRIGRGINRRLAEGGRRGG